MTRVRYTHYWHATPLYLFPFIWKVNFGVKPPGGALALEAGTRLMIGDGISIERRANKIVSRRRRKDLLNELRTLESQP